MNPYLFFAVYLFVAFVWFAAESALDESLEDNLIMIVFLSLFTILIGICCFPMWKSYAFLLGMIWLRLYGRKRLLK
jgi:hypothetical protein